MSKKSALEIIREAAADGRAEVDLRRQGLTEIPREVTRLGKARRLDLSKNKISIIPQHIAQLPQLRWLDLRRNQISEIPQNIAQLPQLQGLNLSYNQISEIPQGIARLPQLQSLNLSYNQISEIPQNIAQLRQLQWLFLSQNRLTRLPAELGKLPESVNLYLHGNPLTEPLPTLVKRGTKELFAYLRGLDDATAQYEAKVLLVGEGAVGKSSLLAAIRGEPFDPQRDTTHGIELGQLRLPHPKEDVEITLNTWDFGGQEVYRVTHQFFFSHRSLYLLVWKPREGQEENAVEGWLKRIRLRMGEDVRVMIVASHCDERQPELDYPALRAEYGDLLAGSYQIDSRTGTGIAELTKAIGAQAARLPQMGEKLNRRWEAAGEELLALREPQIPHPRFVDVCRRHQLDERETSTLAGLLHDLGHVVYYGEDDGLRDVMVLQPEWLTRAIGYVLEDRPTREAAGVLEHARLRRIWTEHGRKDWQVYPPPLHPYFLRLMEKFDVSYRIEGTPRSLVGQLVPFERPELPWSTISPLADGERQLRLICEMDEEPPGLVAWLTVRNHRFSVGRHWRRGVLLEHQKHQGLVELQVGGRELELTVRGRFPDHFMSLLRDSLEYLIEQRWEGLRYKLSVPCPNRVDGDRACRGRFPFRHLLKQRDRSVNQIFCQECDMEQDVPELLTGFATPGVPLRSQLDTTSVDLLEEIREITARAADGVERLEARSAEQIRRVLKAINSENRDCPRLFTLVPVDPKRWDPRRLAQVEYRLTLWCEHPEHQHPCPGGEYKVTVTRKWLARIAPYASLVAKTLKVTVPLIAPAVGLVLDEAAVKELKPQLEFMDKLTATALSGEAAMERDVESPSEGLAAAEGAGLRELRTLLFKLDAKESWAGLRRVRTPAGDYLWVCREHYREYDPGLPDLSGVNREAEPVSSRVY